MDKEKVIKALECCEKKACVYNDTLKECPYWELCGEYEDAFYDCTTALAKDALALLKAQEPRVMTLEEVTEDRPDVVWFDDRHFKLTYPAFVSNGEVIGWVVSLPRGCIERHDHIDGYGKSWRCWTSRPTDAQREAVKWDGEDA